MVGAFAHCGIVLARTADDDQMGEAQFDQSAEAFGTGIGRTDDAEAI